MSRLASAPARLWFAMGMVLVAGFLYGCLMHNPPSVPGIPGFDKMEHAGAFIAMAGWFGVLYRDRFIPLFCVLTSYAALTELLQWASGYRDGDPYDWMADTTGILVGLALAWGAWRLFGPRLQRLFGPAAPVRPG